MAKGLHSVIFIAFLTEVFLYLLLCCGPVVLCSVSLRMQDEKKKSCSGYFNDFRFAWTLGLSHSSFSPSGLSPCCKPKCVARQCQVRAPGTNMRFSQLLTILFSLHIKSSTSSSLCFSSSHLMIGQSHENLGA